MASQQTSTAKVVSKPLDPRKYKHVMIPIDALSEAIEPPAPVPAVPTIPVRDVDGEMKAAHNRLDVMIQEHPRWVSVKGVVPFEDLVIHNEAEYVTLKNLRSSLAQNLKEFLSRYNEQLSKNIPSSKKGGFFKRT